MQTEEIEIREKLDNEVGLMLKNPSVELFLSNYYSYAAGRLTFNEFLSNKMLLVAFIREGVPYSFFDLIMEFSPFDEAYWSDLLGLSTISLHRYKKSLKQFKPLHSEKIIEMAEVTQLGLEVFGSMEKLKLWLETPNFALGSLKPLELLKDSYGKEMVTEELTRINYGILS